MKLCCNNPTALHKLSSTWGTFIKFRLLVLGEKRKPSTLQPPKMTSTKQLFRLSKKSSWWSFRSLKVLAYFLYIDDDSIACVIFDLDFQCIWLRVRSVKSLLLSGSEFRMMFTDIQLQDSDTFSMRKIQNKSTIFLIVRMPGGAPPPTHTHTMRGEERRVRNSCTEHPDWTCRDF